MLSKHHTIRRGFMPGVPQPNDQVAFLRKKQRAPEQPEIPAPPSPPVREMPAPEISAVSEAPPRRRIRYDPRHHAEVFRTIADVTGVHVYCDHRACLRAKRCMAAEPPCFVTHSEDFHEYLRTKLGPRFREQIAKQDFPRAEAG